MLEAGVHLRPPFFLAQELFVSPLALVKIEAGVHLNNPARSSSNLSGADLSTVIAAALRLLSPPGSRS
jgi:hypothetical protein